MTPDTWHDLHTPAPPDEEVWELFHENTKGGLLDPGFSHSDVLAQMREMIPSLAYDQYPTFPLPAPAPLDIALGDAIGRRRSARGLDPAQLSGPQLAALLHAAYGITHENEDGVFPRPFRSVPSAGGLYPLELYVHSIALDGFPAGLYHYDPSRSSLALLHQGDSRRDIAETLVQGDLAQSSSAIVFITALFERTTFKYGGRGYRFTLLEAGHVAQNLNLAAIGLGLTSLNVGGFVDRRADDLLRLDGLLHSTVYICAIGGNGVEEEPATVQIP
jgi:SagB-type dehydrogenase family enzyme